jgi:methylenetetrahydrofolate--tRNA-(uracil-5-)-methyltransferase
MLAGINLARLVAGQAPLPMPEVTMMGALFHYVTHADPRDFQPMKANFGIIPPLQPRVRRKRERYQKYAQRALAALDRWIEENAILIDSTPGG